MSFKHPPLPSDDAPFDDVDNPEWTEADFARAKPLSAFPELIAATRKPGRPIGSTTSDRQQVTLRLPRAVIDHFKADGPGWQTRAVDALVRATTGDRRDQQRDGR